MSGSMVNKAFAKIKRRDFLPDETMDDVHIDAPLPIGFGQTNSQPSTVRMMLEWLEVEPGNKVLDVGSGSGWTSALLAFMVGPKGKVFAVERISELVDFGQQNCSKYGFKNVKFYQAGDQVGLPAQAPFDRLLVSAAASKLPVGLVEQLKVGGKLVIPVKGDVLEITKNQGGELDVQTHPGFMFVPLI
jgi:protein-L-isoaspartate(D-aspartate) O-methyltransferase